jgi:regulator of protease activity HflC (stomatin/prohibitin superfamily)
LNGCIVNYDAPVQKCPTKDNAYVDVDIHFTFRLPQNNEKLVHQFVYRLGAGRFDELLAAEVEENIRNFINTIFLHQVFDLKSDMANDMMQQLNHKFNKYGIMFEQCNVTGVFVNPQLINALTEKTKLKIELKNHQKEQENLKLTLENEEQQKLTLLENKNRREYHLLEEQIKRAVIEQAQSEKEAQTRNDKMLIKAEAEAR